MTRLLLSLSLTWAVLCSARVAVGAEPDLDAAFTAAAHRMVESEHRDRIADAWRASGLTVEEEVATEDNARCDLVTDAYAWEIDFAKKWAEGVGQASFYAEMLDRKPGLILLVDEGDDRYVKRAQISAKRPNVLVLIVPIAGDVPDEPGHTPKSKATAAPTVQRYYFSAAWCGPCHRVAPIVSRLNADQAGIQVLDFDANRPLAQSFGVTALPAFVTVIDGRVSLKQGAHDEDTLKQFYGIIQ